MLKRTHTQSIVMNGCARTWMRYLTVMRKRDCHFRFSIAFRPILVPVQVGNDVFDLDFHGYHNRISRKQQICFGKLMQNIKINILKFYKQFTHSHSLSMWLWRAFWFEQLVWFHVISSVFFFPPLKSVPEQAWNIFLFIFVFFSSGKKTFHIHFPLKQFAARSLCRIQKVNSTERI